MKIYETDIGQVTMKQLMERTGLSRSGVNSRLAANQPFRNKKQKEPVIMSEGVKKTASEWLATVENPPLRSEFVQRIRNGWSATRALQPVKKATKERADEKLPEWANEVDGYIQDTFGYDSKLLHAARLLKQGLTIEQVGLRITQL
jgi:hypothetical protein